MPVKLHGIRPICLGLVRHPAVCLLYEIITGRSASAKRARPEDQATDKVKRTRSASTSHRSPSPKRDYPRGTWTATRPSQASPKRAEHRPAPAQDMEAFKADMTSMLSDMLQSSLSKFASQFNTSSGGQRDSVSAQAAQTAAWGNS